MALSKIHVWLLCVVVVVASGCSNETVGVADGGMSTIELPPLVLEGHPEFNHVMEASIAAHSGHVVITGINEHRRSADSFDYGEAATKRIAVWVSHDGGQSFSSALDVTGIAETSNTVVRVSPDGRLWLVTLVYPFDMNLPAGHGYVFVADDNGHSWFRIGPEINLGDKPWIAPSPDGQFIWIGALNGYWKLGRNGDVLGTFGIDDGSHGEQMTSAIGYGDHALFWNFGFQALLWSGTGPPTVTADLLPEESDPPPEETVPFLSRISASIGLTRDGRLWTVRTAASRTMSDIVLRVMDPPGDLGTDIPVSEGGSAFFPAAAMDDEDRLHVMWYHTSGARGTLRYTRSRSSDLADGFEPPREIDGNAVPGNGWTPWAFDEEGVRRLRDYVDITVQDHSAHLVWTHAPVPPARLWATTVSF